MLWVDSNNVMGVFLPAPPSPNYPWPLTLPTQLNYGTGIAGHLQGAMNQYLDLESTAVVPSLSPVPALLSLSFFIFPLPMLPVSLFYFFPFFSIFPLPLFSSSYLFFSLSSHLLISSYHTGPFLLIFSLFPFFFPPSLFCLPIFFNSFYLSSFSLSLIHYFSPLFQPSPFLPWFVYFTQSPYKPFIIFVPLFLRIGDVTKFSSFTPFVFPSNI